MLLGEDENRNAGEQHVERIVIIEDSAWHTLCFSMDNGGKYGEEKRQNADGVEDDLFFEAEVSAAQIVSANKINRETERKIAVGIHADGFDHHTQLRRNKGGEQGELGKKKGKDER